VHLKSSRRRRLSSGRWIASWVHFFAPEIPGSGRSKDPVGEKRAKVAVFRAKAEEESSKHERSVSINRATALNDLWMGFPHVFQAIMRFSSVSVQAFESPQPRTMNPSMIRRGFIPAMQINSLQRMSMLMCIWDTVLCQLGCPWRASY